MNFVNRGCGQYDQFDKNFEENWGGNYYPNHGEFDFADERSKDKKEFDKKDNDRKDVKTQNYYYDEYDYEEKFDCRRGQSQFTFKPCFPCNRPCNRCFDRPCHQPCNRPCWNGSTNRPCNRDCEWREGQEWDRPTNRPNRNDCDGALLFLSGYFIAKRCK